MTEKLTRAARRNAERDRRRVAAALDRLVATGSCSRCGYALLHGDVTIVGIGDDGKVAYVSDCCVHTVKTIYTCGVYLDKTAVDHHEIIRGIDDVRRRAGLGGGTLRVQAGGDETGDAEWFAAHPTRAHRIRPALPSEADEVLPSGHEALTLIRQVEPGARVRQAFQHDISVEIPDDEHIIAALFDIVVQKKSTGESITAGEVWRLAARYAAAEKGSAS